MSLVSVVFCPQHSSFREPKPNGCDAVLPTNSSCGQELWLDISPLLLTWDDGATALNMPLGHLILQL